MPSDSKASRAGVRPLRFTLSPEKLVSSLAFFAQNTRGLDKLKAVKLLYYADKYHLTRYGRPIIGDIYFRLDYGPVPSKSLNIINDAIDPYKLRNVEQPILDLFSKFIHVNRGKKHATLESKRGPDLEVLSNSEQEALNETVKRYGRCSGPQLIDLTHREAPWKKTKKNAEIDYWLFFEGEPDAKEDARHYFMALPENMEVLFQLSAPPR